MEKEEITFIKRMEHDDPNERALEFIGYRK